MGAVNIWDPTTGSPGSCFFFSFRTKEYYIHTRYKKKVPMTSCEIEQKGININWQVLLKVLSDHLCSKVLSNIFPQIILETIIIFWICRLKEISNSCRNICTFSYIRPFFLPQLFKRGKNINGNMILS